MKIDLPNHIIKQLLIESGTFREYIVNNCISQEPIKGIEFYRELVRTHFPDLKEKQKIPAIKWIRELSRNNEDMLNVFAGHGYESIQHDAVSDKLLGLAAAKRFVESC